MSDATSNDNSNAKRPGRRWRNRLLALLLGLIVFWGIPEIVVRIADPTLERFTEIVFMGDPNSRELFMKDPYLYWKLRPDVKLTFLGSEIRTNAEGFRGPAVESGRRNILLVGDSGTFGWRVAEGEAFPAKLAALLNAQPGSEKWQALNAGVPGYSSHQVREVAERLIRTWKPEVVVICVGNNDPAPTVRSDAQLADDRSWAAPLAAALSHSRLLVWVSEQFQSEKVETFHAKSLADARPRVSKEELADNLQAMIQAARDAGATPVVLAPPVNLYVPPRVRAGMFPDVAQWSQWARRVQMLVQQRKLDDAAAEADKILADSNGHFYATWLRGIVLAEQGDLPAARTVLEIAFEKHPFPERSPLSYRQTIERVAGTEGATTLDPNAVFREVMDGPAAQGLYLDWCHPSALGHEIIARRLAAMIAELERNK
jgi:lysophospholipase L1-like esterase